MNQDREKSTLFSARLSDSNRIVIELDENITTPQLSEFLFSPEINVLSAQQQDGTLLLQTDTVDISKSYILTFRNAEYELSIDEFLNQFYSDKELGWSCDSEKTYFRLFAPRAKYVHLLLYKNAESENYERFEMQKDENGIWELCLPGMHFGKYYSYSVDGPKSKTEMFDPEKIIADPYSKAVVTKNEYLHRGLTLIQNSTDYDWEGDAFKRIAPEDLIIYECHIRDLTAHPTAGAEKRFAGSYRALVQNGIRGGIEHIKSLGVNAVEFLPIFDFGNIEVPFGKDIGGVTNTWNPYARNHWGYMTSYFFAPESYYASEQSLEPGKTCGADGRQVKEFKDVVKAFHKNGMAVILDVVYNHVAQYDQNCFKQIDKKYYFRLNEDLSFCSASGCGNDFRTERPMARKLILDSVKFWMQEYHIDGFRFDLASMIDWETCEQIYKEAKKINPDAIIIAEPWGGGKYTPAEFSQRGWAAWNDQFRNGVKGQNPHDGHGFIFGQWFDYNSVETIKRYILGNPVDEGGLFADKSHAINYLESHDDHTFGDFIRIALGGSEKIDKKSGNAKLTVEQLKLNKLGALILLTSQGSVMIHEGQEYARSKVIAPTECPDERVGYIDFNSYNKDNETNWLNYDFADMNIELVNYYKGLFALRKKHPAFRHSDRSDITFFDDPKNDFALAYFIDKKSSEDTHDFFVMINAHKTKSAKFKLFDGDWVVVVNEKTAGIDPVEKMNKHLIDISPRTAFIFRR